MHDLDQEKDGGTGPPERTPTGGTPGSAGGRLTDPRVLLGAVAVCYAAAQFALVTPAFGIEWDEAVYLSQFSGNGTPIAFHASRGWGTPLIVAPVVAFTDSVAVLRTYLMLLSALLLFGAFRVWLPLRPGHTVPVAAGLFAGCWPAVLYGAEAMPNGFTAFGAVALTGLVLRAVMTDTGRERTLMAAVAGLVVAVSLFRPTDAVVIVLSLAAPAALTLRSPDRRRRAAGVITALAGGLVVAGGMWAVDAVWRYGSLTERMEQATALFGPYRWLIDHYLRSLDGPVSCSTAEACGPLPVGGLMWAAGFLLLVAAGTAAAWRRTHRMAVAVPVAVGACVLGAYLYQPLVPHPRYLLPAYALMSIAAAEGLLLLLVRRRRVRAGYAVASCCLLVGGHLHSQAGHLIDNVERLAPGRARDAAVAAEIARIGHRRPCLVYGWHAPQIGHHLGCEAAGTSAGRPLPAVPGYVAVKAARGYSVIAVYRGDTARIAPDLGSWREHRLSDGWFARVNDGEIDLGTPPDAAVHEPGL
jgi:hypothetical protein